MVGYIGHQSDSVIFADERVTFDHHIRVRVDRQRIGVCTYGFATGSRLMNRSGEDVLRDVAVNREVAHSEGGIGVAFHQLVVAIPSEDVREFSRINTAVSVSRNRYLTTVADVIDRQTDRVDGRNRTDNHCVGTVGFASRRSLEHAHPEYGGLMDTRGQSGLRGTPNLVGSGRITLVPSVGQIAVVVVTEVGGQCHHTVRADCIFCGGNFNNDRVVYIYIVRSAFHAATVRVVHNNRIDVRVILRTTFVNDGVTSVHCAIGVGISDGVIVEQPSVGQFGTHVIIGDVGIQFDDCIFANDRVAGDNHCRVRIDRQRVIREGSDRLATGGSLLDRSAINILGDITVNRQRAFREDGVGNTLNHFVITEPSEDIFIAGNTAGSVSHHRDLTTVADAGIADDNRVNHRIFHNHNLEAINRSTKRVVVLT